MMSEVDEILVERIIKLKQEKNAVVLGHYYQVPEIQDISDFVGDSLALSQKAKNTKADIIVFCGVHFMAETAKIVSPHKKVLIPDIEAGCSLADSCKKVDFEEFIADRPDHTVISYINCSAEIKALSDIICTSSNAVEIVRSMDVDKKIIFAPDKNLGAYINNITGRNMVLWDGTCEVHDIISLEKVLELKQNNKSARLIAHPECKAQILAIADYIGSTRELLDYTIRDNGKEYIVASESGIIHQMKKYNPDKTFIVVPTKDSCMCNDCPYMKLNTLAKLYNCLKDEKFEIILEEEILIKARKPIELMLKISDKIGL